MSRTFWRAQILHTVITVTEHNGQQHNTISNSTTQWPTAQHRHIDITQHITVQSTKLRYFYIEQYHLAPRKQVSLNGIWLNNKQASHLNTQTLWPDNTWISLNLQATTLWISVIYFNLYRSHACYMPRPPTLNISWRVQSYLCKTVQNDFNNKDFTLQIHTYINCSCLSQKPSWRAATLPTANKHIINQRHYTNYET
jgi:hypothetical protein